MLDSSAIEHHDGDPSATLRILLSVEGENGRRLERRAEARGKQPGDIVAELLRYADRPAACPGAPECSVVEPGRVVDGAPTTRAERTPQDGADAAAGRALEGRAARYSPLSP